MISYFLLRFSHNFTRKQKNQGFTLLELLVVVILMGVLAALALPNLLSQVAKGRQSEAKNNLGAINRAQQAYRLETSTFGTVGDGTTGTLPIKITGTNYDYADATGVTINSTFASQVANAKPEYQDDILDYTAAVNQQTDGDFVTLICQTDVLNGAIKAINTTVGDGTIAPTCGLGSTRIK